MSKTSIGEYYSEYDVESGAYCVFHTETSKAYYSYASPQEAEEKAQELNNA